MKRLLLLLLCFGGLASAALTTVAQTLVNADGTNPTGTCVISWPYFTSVTGAGVAANRKTLTVTAGAVSVTLEPNDHTSTVYTVVCTWSTGRVVTEYWRVGTSTPVTVVAVRLPVPPQPSIMVTKGQLPAAGAYEDEANIFTTHQTIANQMELRLREAVGTGTNYIGIRAPSALAANFTLTLAALSAGYFKIDGSGNVSWAFPPFSEVTGTIADAQVPHLNTLSTGLTVSRCVETDGSGFLTVAAGLCGSGGLGDPGANGLVNRTALNTTNEIVPTDDRIPVANGTIFEAKALPDCDDSVGQHLNYDTATNTWSCGTSSSGASPLTTKGDLYTFTSINARLPVGANGLCLVADSGEATGLKWDACGTGSAHAMLSATHSDTTTGTVLRGDIITGQTASPEWTRLALGSNGQCVKSDGTDVVWGSCGGGGALTHRVSLLNSSAQPDSTGNVFSELYTVKATNDFWKHAVWTFNDSATKDCIYGSTLIPNDYSTSAVAYVFWTSTATSGNAIWDWEYRGIGGDDAESLDQATAVESLTVTDAAPTATDRRMTSSMAITSANLAASDTLQWRLCRDGASADTIAAALTVHDVVLEYVTP